MPRPLFRRWPDVAALVGRAHALWLFLDFDGTLVGLRAKPEEVALDAETRAALNRLARRRGLRITIVSGRRRSDLITRVGVPRIGYWGLFGWERRRRLSLPQTAYRALRTARTSLAEALKDVAGVRIENKGLALAIHVRDAGPAATQRARDIVFELCDRPGSGLRVFSGRDVFNLVPQQVRDKGAAVTSALERNRSRVLPIYVGDDATDEPAFAALEQLTRGITVRVGPARGTRARYRLANPRDVHRFLEQLDGVL